MVSKVIFFFTFAFILLLALCSCQRQNSRAPDHSFYYWKTSYTVGSSDINEINKLGVNHFYIHYFDVDWSEDLSMPVPKAEFRSTGDMPFINRQYTPVVFITNRTFERISDMQCDELAEKVWKKVNAITTNLENKYLQDCIEIQHDAQLNRDSISIAIEKTRVAYRGEIQIDCDWTSGTRDKYFHFLRSLKNHYPDKKLSVTIRLYPYKYYSKMGVPPVDKGMLMCYNLGSINMLRTNNSIFDLRQLKKYLSDTRYPIPLDIALPVFGWYVWFRNGQYMGIIHATPDFINDTATFKKQGNNLYRLANDTVIEDKYYREGDMLRMEFPDEKELTEAANIVTKEIPNYGGIAFYYWDYPLTGKYENAIQQIYHHY